MKARHSIPAMFAIALMGVLPSLCPGAEGDGQPVSETVEVSIVDVRVTVTDKSGNPVTDLREDEFQVKDNGAAQPLLGASLVSSTPLTESVPQGAGKPVAVIEPRHFLILFDLTYNDMEALKSARMAAIDFLQKGLTGSDDAGIFTIDITSGVRTHMNFTRDREQLLDAVQNLGGTRGNSFLADSAGLVRIVPYDRHGPAGPAYASKGFDVNPKDIPKENMAYVYRDVKRANVQQYRQDARRYLTTLNNFARSLDVMPGRKITLFFTRGFDLKALGGETLKETEENNMNFVMGMFERLDYSTREVDGQNIDLLAHTAFRFSTSDCRVYCIDPSGNREKSSSPDAPEDASFRTGALLEQLAKETGGEVYRHTNNYQGALEEVTTATSAYYLLTYTAPQSRTGKYHRVSVEVTRPGVEVECRKGYYEDKPFQEYDPIERSLQVAAIVNETRSTAGLTITANAFQLPHCTAATKASSDGQSGLLQVEGIIEVPRDVLQGLGPAEKQEIEMFLFAVSEPGREIYSCAHGFARLLDSTSASSTSQKGVRFLGLLTVPLGSYRVMGIARDLHTGECAVGAAPLTLSPPSSLMISSCMVSEGGGWLTLASTKNACFPMTFGETLVPARATPNVKSGEECLMLVTLSGLARDASSGKPSMDLSMKTVGQNGQLLPISGYTALQDGWTSTGDYKLMCRVKLPDGLGSGAYRLDVEAVDRVTEKAASTAVPFVVGQW